MIFSQLRNNWHHHIGDRTATDRNNAAGIGNNAAGIGNNAAEISDDTAENVNIAAKVIPC